MLERCEKRAQEKRYFQQNQSMNFANAKVFPCARSYSANIFLSTSFEDVTFAEINETCEMRLNVV